MKIGILQTGRAPAELASEFDDYPKMFEDLLAGEGFVFRSWAVLDMEFPDSPDDADGWLITGSRHGAYEDLPWIAPLEDLIRRIRAAGKPLVGVCFGHQIIAQALGGKVEKYRDGWAVGRQAYDTAEGPVHLNAWHQDQVVQRPEGAQVVAANDFCENAALLYDDSIYTVQAHPEYEDGFIEGLIRTRGRGVVPERLMQRARQNMGQPNDTARIAAQFARFFRERRIA